MPLDKNGRKKEKIPSTVKILFFSLDLPLTKRKAYLASELRQRTYLASVENGTSCSPLCFQYCRFIAAQVALFGAQ